MLCKLCRAVLCCVVLCRAVSCRVVLCRVVLCCVMLCCVVLCSGTVISPHPSSKRRDRMLPLAGVDGTGSEVIKEDDGGCSQQKAARDRNQCVYRLTCDKNPGRV